MPPACGATPIIVPPIRRLPTATRGGWNTAPRGLAPLEGGGADGGRPGGGTDGGRAGGGVDGVRLGGGFDGVRLGGGSLARPLRSANSPCLRRCSSIMSCTV